MNCPGCGRSAKRWKDDVTHPNLTEMQTAIECSYGPVYGWYFCAKRGDLRSLEGHLTSQEKG
jgi:hypothetical protein